MRYEFAVNLLNLPLSSESRLEGLGLAYMSNDPSLLPWITEMNTMAYVLGMSATNFENPHGLSSKLHKSTASDVARLSVEALKSQLFRKIVNTESYAVNIVNSRDSSSRRIIWKNTNELLQEGYSGIKTGTTPTTGYSLASEYCFDVEPSGCCPGQELDRNIVTTHRGEEKFNLYPARIEDKRRQVYKFSTIKQRK
eukprot:379895-Hanusia_phi.AAC.4